MDRIAVVEANHAETHKRVAALGEEVKSATQRAADAHATARRAAEHPVAPSRLGETVLGALRAIAMVLAVRLLIGLSLVGTFVLALLAMQNQSLLAVALTAAFAVLTLGPLTVLEVRHRPPVAEEA